MHFDPPTIQRGMKYNEDCERNDEENQRQRDAHNVQDAHRFVECHLRQAGVVVRPGQVGVFIPLPSSISLAILLRGFAISIEFWIVRMIPEFAIFGFSILNASGIVLHKHSNKTFIMREK